MLQKGLLIQQLVAAKALATRDRIPTLIEVDSDGHRAGIRADEVQRLVEVGRALHNGGAELRGILTHAGRSYECRTTAEIEAFAEKERVAAVRSASVLRDAGLAAPIVSIGSTPTALFVKNLQGVTEVRAGTFTFFDLFMTGLVVEADHGAQRVGEWRLYRRTPATRLQSAQWQEANCRTCPRSPATLLQTTIFPSLVSSKASWAGTFNIRGLA